MIDLSRLGSSCSVLVFQLPFCLTWETNNSSIYFSAKSWMRPWSQEKGCEMTFVVNTDGFTIISTYIVDALTQKPLWCGDAHDILHYDEYGNIPNKRHLQNLPIRLFIGLKIVQGSIGNNFLFFFYNGKVLYIRLLKSNLSELLNNIRVIECYWFQDCSRLLSTTQFYMQDYLL